MVSIQCRGFIAEKGLVCVMAKSGKDVFFCKECGYESNGWLGKCPSCGEWNTFVAAPAAPKGKAGGALSGFSASQNEIFRKTAAPSLLKDAKATEKTRTKTGLEEFDRVLGGGMVKGSLTLVSGDPGIGKSTLMLMISGNIAQKMKVLYVSGEESAEQLKMRADRLGISSDSLYVLAETSMSAVYDAVEELSPECIIVDSIQTMCDDNVQSAAGSISQVREITGALMKLAKTTGITTFIVGHVTKDGAIAGPKVLEHMVDTVLYFEGERQLYYRIMRCVKNRFGSTNEIGVFEMTSGGLKEVPNPSAAFLEGRPEGVPGTTVACTLEGSRPIFVEIQALISGSNLNNPRRMSQGIDYNRLSMLLAVLEKRMGLNIVGCDAYVNVIGGLKIDEPAADLALVAAIVSSCGNFAVPENSVFFGEIGLTGEVRAVSHADKRLGELLRLGFKKCYMPAANRGAVQELEKAEKKKSDPAEIIYISNVKELRW